MKSKKSNVENDYTMGQQLGTGKFSIVKVAVQKSSGQRVAIKIVPKAGCPASLLMKEVEIMQFIGQHPGVVSLLDLYEDSETVFLVLELATGGELFEKIVATDVYSEKMAADYIRQVVEVIAHLHDKKIVHRDLKPENLLLQDSSAKHLKVCDFGLAAILERDDEVLDLIVGSPNYMAPEILAGTGYDKSVDMYSIGTFPRVEI
jgi:serine/threonine protein kinase